MRIFLHLLVSNRFWHFAHFRNALEAFGPVIFFLVFMRIFLHLLVSNRFWHFAHFRNAQRHAIQLYIFFVLMSVFGILPIFEMHRGMWPDHIFLVFMRDLKKSYQSKFQNCCPTKIKKNSRKSFPFQKLKKG